MVSALSNIFKIPELRAKITFTLIMFAVFRMGTHIPVPGVDPSAIEQLFNSGSLFGLLDLFSGGALSKFSNLLAIKYAFDSVSALPFAFSKNVLSK